MEQIIARILRDFEDGFVNRRQLIHDRVRDELMRRKLLTENARPDTGGGIPGYSSFHVSDPDGFNLQIGGWTRPKDSVTKK